MHTPFDLFKERFLPWRTTGGLRVAVGLQKALEQAGELAPFGDAGPQTTFAVVRVLLVLMHQTRPTCDDDEWRRLWDASQFPDDWLAAIEKVASEKFDLFHSKGPFLQMNSSDLEQLLAEERAAEAAKKKNSTTKKKKSAETEDETETKRKTPAYLFGEVPTGSNINHAHHAFDKRTRLCPSCCVQGLLRLAPFCPEGGRSFSASVNGSPPVYFLPVWDTLLRTLLFNWSTLWVNKGDRAAWDGGPLRESGPIGVAEGFTWEPRRVWLCPPNARLETCNLCGNPDSPVVREMIFKKHRKTKLTMTARLPRVAEWRDPHLSYAVGSQGKKNEAFPLIAQEPPKGSPELADGRWTLKMWTKIADALLRAPIAGESATGCRSVAEAYRILAGSEQNSTVACIAPFVRAGQDKTHLVRPDIWVVPPLTDTARDNLLRELKWLEEGRANWAKDQQARKKKRKAEPDTTLLPDLGQPAEFERRVEGHFRALLDRKGEMPEEWREAVRAAARELTRPEPVPGRALEAVRTRQATRVAIDAAFPLPPEEVMA